MAKKTCIAVSVLTLQAINSEILGLLLAATALLCFAGWLLKQAAEAGA